MRALSFVAALAAAPFAAQAIQICDLDGVRIDINNGSATAGKTGTVRCREGEGGPLRREQQLQNGVFKGFSRYFREGVLQRDYSVNEKGNQEGLSREYAATPGPKNQLLREETMRNGSAVGITRTWFADGTLRRVSFRTDDNREQAVAEFTEQGRLTELRCGPQAQLGKDADDATWCGHRGNGLATVELFNSKGAPKARYTFERGERRKAESLWDNGKPRQITETGATAGSERSFSEEGVKRREVQWLARKTDDRTQRITTLEQEFHESGTMTRERRYTPTERGSELQLEQHWYLNGQLRDKTEYALQDGKATKRETTYFDNGRVSTEGLWFTRNREQDIAFGVHKRFDEAGRLRGESYFDARGRVNRERELDESGRATRDEEVFEDGSRKAFSR